MDQPKLSHDHSRCIYSLVDGVFRSRAPDLAIIAMGDGVPDPLFRFRSDLRRKHRILRLFLPRPPIAWMGADADQYDWLKRIFCLDGRSTSGAAQHYP